MTEGNCKSALKLLQVKKEKQGDGGLVPGGPIVYLHIEKIPDVQFGSWFKRLDHPVRDIIRQAFKDAWNWES